MHKRRGVRIQPWIRGSGSTTDPVRSADPDPDPDPDPKANIAQVPKFYMSRSKVEFGLFCKSLVNIFLQDIKKSFTEN